LKIRIDMFDLKFPDYEIILWIKNNDFRKKLEKEIFPITNPVQKIKRPASSVKGKTGIPSLKP